MSETICFSESLYRREAVENSIKNYQQLADFSLAVDEKGIVVFVENIHPDLESELIDSFFNYVLNETIILSRKENGGDV